jgi:hypothetical protein
MKWFAMSKLQTQPHHHEFLAATKLNKRNTPHNSSKIPLLFFTHKTQKHKYKQIFFPNPPKFPCDLPHTKKKKKRNPKFQ